MSGRFENKFFPLVSPKGVILTKDSLINRNWKGSQKCCFYDCNKTIKYLFFNCHHAKTVWRTIYIATGLTPPSSVSHMSGSWLSNFDFKREKYILVGVVALRWAIWKCCNDLFFSKLQIYIFYAVYFQGNILATVLGTIAT